VLLIQTVSINAVVAHPGDTRMGWDGAFSFSHHPGRHCVLQQQNGCISRRHLLDFMEDISKLITLPTIFPVDSEP
jgi:hypothetical protein